MSTENIVLFHQGSTELWRCENCVFFLPVNILTGVTRRLLGPHDTLPCVLITATVGTEIRLYTPLLCAKFQGNRIRRSRFIAVFVSVRENRKKNKKKTKKLSQFLKSHISGMPEAISLKFGMWSTEVGGSIHSKNRLFSSRYHRATEL